MPKRWPFSIALCLLLVLTGALPASARPVDVRPANARPSVQAPAPSYSLYIIPALVRRMCVGDSYTFAIHVQWQEPADEDLPLAPLVPSDDPNPPVVPLDVREVVVSTTAGSVSQAVFVVDEPVEAFSFTYYAEQPGQETMQVSMEGIASDEYSFEVLESCDYELTFFASAEEEVEGGMGGFEGLFYGAGEFGASRSEAEAEVLEGRGDAQVELGIWADVPEAFACTMDAYGGSGAFEIGGMAGFPSPEFMHFTLFFEPMTMPSQMLFTCQMTGYGTVQLPIPVGPQTANPDDMGLAGIVLPIDGGVYDFSEGKMTGKLVVRRKR